MTLNAVLRAVEYVATRFAPKRFTSPGVVLMREWTRVLAVGQRESPPGFRQDIQGLRGVAVLLVVAYHAGWGLSGGFIGVDVFFVVSGFLIGGLLLDELRRDGHIRLRRFFTRRVRRLLPALAVTTSGTLLLSLFIVERGGRLDAVIDTATAASVFVANLQLYRASDYFAPAAELNPLLHLWSLSLEEQFYFALPVAIVAVAWVARRRAWQAQTLWRVLGVVLAGVALLSFVVSSSVAAWFAEIFSLGAPLRVAFYSPLARAWEFLAGVLLAYFGRRSITSQRVTAGLSIAGLVLVLAAAMLFDAETRFPGASALVPVLGAVGLIAGGTGTSPVARILTRRGLVWLGDISYSWYLWHWPFIVFSRMLWPDTAALAATSAALASLLPACWSYRYVEQPVRRDETLVGVRVLALAATCIMVPVALAVGIGALNAARTESEREIDLTLSQSKGCQFVRTDRSEWPEERCLLRASDDAPVVLVLGDSHAGALAWGAYEAALERDLSLAMWTWGGRPFVGEGSFVPPTGEADSVSASLDLILRLSPDIIVIANRSPRYLDEDLVDRWSDQVESSASERLNEWGVAVSALLNQIEPMNIPIIWVLVVPEFEEGVAIKGSLFGLEARSQTLSLAEVRERRGAVVDVEREVLSQYSNVALFDPVPHLCRAECSTIVDGELIYIDDNHINRRGSSMLAEPLGRAIDALLGE